MKKLILFFLLSVITNIVFAQSELSGSDDSSLETSANNKQYGKYLLDMNLLAPPIALRLPLFDFTNVTTDYNSLFRLNPNVTYGKETSGSIFQSYYGYGYSPFQSLQTGSFKLNDNLRFNLYGGYSADGRKLPNTSAYPWEKNDFRGGMELKMNKNFGIRVEVQRRGNAIYPY
ncbi:hypothetical protein EZS27_011008 [termite gut metagenome]|uniref:Uncharacterized protein n=1 Tax=termite gut metagenome TaxID=433724 RepID=A0A5J4S520_9ZZZZ